MNLPSTETATPSRLNGFMEARDQAFRALAHKRRCRQLPPPSDAEVARMVSEFTALKPVTVCPAVYLLPTR